MERKHLAHTDTHTHIPCVSKSLPTDLYYFRINQAITDPDFVTDFDCLGISYGLPIPTSYFRNIIPLID